MKRMLFNATYQEELRVAMVEGQKLINFDIETTAKEQRRGNIYKGLITRVEPSLEACFVDYGMEKQGFLPFKEIDPAYLPEGARHREFNRLTVGTELIVQVEKDERGNKGAALTSYITLPGRYLVLMPNNPKSGGVSRRIEGEERDELKSAMSQLEVPQGMSVIIRTAALGRASDELQWDLSYLLKLWNAIITASSTNKGAFLIYQESNLVIRSIRDHFSPDVSEVLIDMEEVYIHARNFMAQVMPNFVERIKLYRDDVPLFSRFQIEHQIESAYSRTVNLPSGGAIVIDHTEALTSVDVNSAKANKGSDIEATALATNLEAADEISRQMRLRDLGGLLVVDFIDMENLRNQREVETFFKQQLSLDRARIQMGKLSKFGLLELSRQRLQASLEESSTTPCPRCSGVGSIRGTESTAVHVLRIIQEEAVKNSQHLAAIHVQLPIEIATYLLNEKRDDVARIEVRMKVKIVLIPNLHLDTPNYKIRKISNENQELFNNKLSYNLVEAPEEVLHSHATTDKIANNKKAMVQNIAPTAPIAQTTSIVKTISKAWNKLVLAFKPDESESTKPIIKKVPYKKNSTTQNRTPHNTNKLNNVLQSSSTTNKRQTTVRPAKPTNNKVVNNPTPVITKVIANATNIENVTPKTQQPSLATTSQANDIPNNTPVIVAQPTATKAPRTNNNVRTNPNRNQIEPQSAEDSLHLLSSHELAPQKQSNSRQAPSAINKRIDKPVAKVVTPKIKANKNEQPILATTIGQQPPKKQQIIQVIEEIKPIRQRIVKVDVNSTPVEDKKSNPVKTAKPITEKVDLGSLEMVATNTNLAPKQNTIEVKPTIVKRYNDVATIKKNVSQETVTYEIVETKHN